MTKIISIRVDEVLLNFLIATGQTNLFFTETKGEVHVNLGKTIKALLTWCQHHRIDMQKPHGNFDNHCRQLLEQVHVVLPHLLLLARAQCQPLLDTTSDDAFKALLNAARAYVDSTCGNYQRIPYDVLETQLSGSGLRQVVDNTE